MRLRKTVSYCYYRMRISRNGGDGDTNLRSKEDICELGLIMKTHQRHDRSIALAIIIIVLIVGFVWVKSKSSGPVFLGSSKNLAQHRRVLLLYHADHEALLKAGREILRQGPKDPWNYRPRGPIHILGFPVPRGVRIPKVVRNLRPHATLINFEGYVVLQMEEGIVGFGVKIYPKGYNKPPNRSFGYGNRELLPGLWYFDNKYDQIPGYGKKIDEVIQTGRWSEPNDAEIVDRSN